MFNANTLPAEFTSSLGCPAGLGSKALVPLLRDAQLDTLVAWQRNVSLASLADDENVV